LQNLKNNSLDICAHVVIFILNLDKQLALKNILVENKGPPSPPSGFKQMFFPIIAIGHAMVEIFWVCLNAKGTAIKCAVL
jgi:hypothetical protein